MSDDERLGIIHPQQKRVNRIIDDVMTKKFGENWADKYKKETPESQFEIKRKRFQTEPPKARFRIDFSKYKKEMHSCIEKGCNPTFGYPVMMFTERFRSYDPSRPKLPERLNPKFHRGIQPIITHRTQQRQDLQVMQEYIQRKTEAQISNQEEQFYEQERINGAQPQLNDKSPMLNIATPLYRAIARSTRSYVKSVVEEKRSIERYDRNMQANFAKGSPLRLIKRSLDTDSEIEKKSEKKKIKKKKGKQSLKRVESIIKKKRESNQSSAYKRSDKMMERGQGSNMSITSNGSSLRSPSKTNPIIQPKHIKLISIQRNDTNASVSEEELEEHPKRSTRPNHLVNLKVCTGATFEDKKYKNGNNIDNSAQLKIKSKIEKVDKKRLNSALENSNKQNRNSYAVRVNSGKIKHKNSLRKQNDNSKTSNQLNEDMNQSYIVSTQKSTCERQSNQKTTLKNNSIVGFDDYSNHHLTNKTIDPGSRGRPLVLEQAFALQNLSNYENDIEQDSLKPKSPPQIREISYNFEQSKSKFRKRICSQGQQQDFDQMDHEFSKNSQINYISDGLISRAHLKFRLRTHKKSQSKAFKTHFKEISQFADPMNNSVQVLDEYLEQFQKNCTKNQIDTDLDMFSILSGRTMPTAKRGSEPAIGASYTSSQVNKNKDVRILMKPRSSYNQTPNIHPNKQFDQYLNMSSYQISNGSDKVNGMSRRIDQIRRFSKKGLMGPHFNGKGPVILSNESAKDAMSVVSSNNINAITAPIQTIDTIKEMPYDESAISSVNTGQFTINGRQVRSNSRATRLRSQLAQQRKQGDGNFNQRDNHQNRYRANKNAQMQFKQSSNAFQVDIDQQNAGFNVNLNFSNQGRYV